MLKSTLIAGGLALLMLNTAPDAAGAVAAAELNLEPTINGAVSATGLFPSQGMENDFHDFLLWTRGQGISPVAAFDAFQALSGPGQDLDAVLNGSVSATGRFPTQAMEDQFSAYEGKLSPQGPADAQR